MPLCLKPLCLMPLCWLHQVLLKDNYAKWLSTPWEDPINHEQPLRPYLAVQNITACQQHNRLGANSLKIVESSKFQNSLKSMIQIKQQILQFFNQYSHKDGCRFFFCCHGRSNGDLTIQTIENPDGEKLTIEELIEMWWQKERQGTLWMYFDSCYSGNIAYRAQAYAESFMKQNHSPIEIKCASGPKQISFDIIEIGGLLTYHQCAWASNRNITKERKEELYTKYIKSKPMFCSIYFKFTKIGYIY